MNRIQLKAAAPPCVLNEKMSEHLQEGEPLVPFSGIAALYGVEIDRGFRTIELVAGCFADSIGKPEDIVILAHHYSDTPIGKVERFRDTAEALEMDFLVNPNTQAGWDVVTNAEHAIISGLSVGFDILDTEIVRVGEGPRAYDVEKVTRAKLREVSVVVFPAIDGARVKQGDAAPTEAAAQYPQAQAALSRLTAQLAA